MPRKPWAAALWFAAAALSKETAIVIPLTLAVVSLCRGLSRPAAGAQTAVARGGVALELRAAAGRLVRLALRQDRLSLRQSRVSALQRAGQPLAAAHSGRIWPSRAAPDRAHEPVCAGADGVGGAAARVRGPDAEGHDRAAIAPSRRDARFFFCLLVNALLFSVLGGALLTRYLLPMYPLVLLLAVTTFYRRVPYWQGLALFSAAAFVVGLFVNPPYGFAPEDNLAYAHVIRLHEAGIAQLNGAIPAPRCSPPGR